MNSCIAIETDYLRSDRTIETILVRNSKSEKLFWVYNFEGIHFRLFETWLAVDHFFKHAEEPLHSFNSETDVDDYLLQVPL